MKGRTLTITNELGLPLKTINVEHLQRIMSLRLEEILEIVAQDLEQAGALDYLRAGVFLCGGCARVPNIIKLAEHVFQLPVSIGQTNSISGLKSALDQPEFVTAIGLAKFGSLKAKKRDGKSSFMCSTWNQTHHHQFFAPIMNRMTNPVVQGARPLGAADASVVGIWQHVLNVRARNHVRARARRTAAGRQIEFAEV